MKIFGSRFIPAIAVGLLCLMKLAVFAQDYSYHAYKNNKEKYAWTLETLLENARNDLGIEIVCDKNVEPFLQQKVPMAPWKFWNDSQLRLAYILAPLDLTFEKTGKNSYRVYEPWYQNRPESEAAAHLKRLLRQYPDRTSWEKRKSGLREGILKMMGLSPLPKKTPLRPIYNEKRVHDGYTVQDVALEIIPRYYLSGSLYRPTNGNGPFPLIASPHGHGRTGRFGEDNQLRCATLARMGAIVFSYSMFAWIAEESPLKFEDHRNPISGTMQTLSTFRVIDFLTSLDVADPGRIGITGASGGGTQSFLGTALDDRITVSVPVVMVSSHFFGGCPCESGIPFHTLSGGTNNAEIAAFAAPRPMLLIGVSQDWTKNTNTVEAPYIRKIYEYYGAGEKLESVLLEEKHDYTRNKRLAMYPFMAKHLGLDISKADESKVTIEPREQMLVFGANREKYPANGITSVEDVIRALEESRK